MTITDDLLKYFQINGSYKINDGLVDVEGEVYMKNAGLLRELRLPVKFGNITGNFSTAYVKLTTLIGSPETVSGYFDCMSNNLSTMEGAPKTVHGNFICDDNILITSLKGSPVIGNYCQCRGLVNLISLNFIQARYISCDWTPTLHILSGLKCEFLDIQGNEEVTRIMQQYNNDKSQPLRSRIIQCQRDLIDAGLSENAKL